MARASWDARVVASLCQSKQDGYTFRVGWAIAMRENRPTSGVEREMVEDGWFERVCREAWEGARPRLARFSMALLVPEDGSRDARLASHHIYAAAA